MVFDATKVVQAERNGKKNLFFLAFPGRRLPCPGSAGRREKYYTFVTWNKFLAVFLLLNDNWKKSSTFATRLTIS